jgi:hypothetical protein
VWWRLRSACTDRLILLTRACTLLLQVTLHMQLAPTRKHEQPPQQQGDDNSSTQQQPDAATQCLAIRRTLRGDSSRTYVQRPGSSSWVCVSQVGVLAAAARVLQAYSRTGDACD